MNPQHKHSDVINVGLIPGNAVRINPAPARVGGPRPADAPLEPQVDVIREGDVIKSIEVTCTCGQKIRIHCAY